MRPYFSLFLLALMVLPMIASAANDSFTPSFKDGIKDIPADVKSTLDRVINWGQVALVAVALIFTIYHGILMILAGRSGDASGRSSHMSSVFLGIGMLILVGVVIALINYIVK